MEYAQKLISTRRGTIVAGAAAAACAGFVLLLYMNQYRSSVNQAGADMTVLVAKNLIEKGMPGDVIGSKELFQTTEAPQAQLKEGAITDPAALHGRVAVRDIYPGQQITIADFSASVTDALGTRIADAERAISVPLDSAHGMIGHVEAGDRVDVLAGFNVVPLVGLAAGKSMPVIKVLMQNALVLEAPDGSSSAAGSRNDRTSSSEPIATRPRRSRGQSTTGGYGSCCGRALGRPHSSRGSSPRKACCSASSP